MSVLVSIGVLLFVVTAVLNVIVFNYGRGAVRAAMDEAVRSGATFGESGGTEACQAKADEVLDGLLGGSMGEGVTVTCAAEPGMIVATAVLHFEGWFGSVTDHDSTIVVSAVRENS